MALFMRKGILAALCFWALGMAVTPALFAADTKAPETKSEKAETTRIHADRIAAVVNDQVITLHQVQARTALNLRQLGLESPSAEQQRAVFKRTLSGMIDEELQRQFAQKIGMSVSKQDMEKGRKAVITQVGGPVAWEKLTKGLTQTAEDKMEAELLWQKISEQAIKPHVQVGMAEVDKLLQELAKSRHVVERQISMIMLGAGQNPEEEKERLDKMNDLKAQLEKGGDFNTLARTYSEDASASKGGELGWFGAGELNPQLEDALDKMQPGAVSEIIRTPVGWHLVKLENVRTTKPVDTRPVTQFDVYMLAAAAPKDDAKAKTNLTSTLEKQAKALRKPADVQAYFEKKDYQKDFPESAALGWMAPGDLQEGLQKALTNVKQGQWSAPTEAGSNVAVLYVAGQREVMPANLEAYRQRVFDNIFNNRVELETRRFLQTLRQRAFVDVRL
jgi:peptidyl-prolyl cis-trans isomerase SurA